MQNDGFTQNDASTQKDSFMQRDGLTQKDGFMQNDDSTQKYGFMENDGFTQKDGFMQNDGSTQNDVCTQKVAWADASDDELVWPRRPPEAPTGRTCCGKDSLTTPMASTKHDKATRGQRRRRGRLN